jgi:very-short-patch-repair endonuclease
MLKLIYEAQLPVPEVNVRLQGFEVDFLWRKQRLIVEMDGFAFHGHRRAFQRDRRRDQILEGAGYTVFRVTWQQLVGEPLALAVRLANALVRH